MITKFFKQGFGMISKLWGGQPVAKPKLKLSEHQQQMLKAQQEHNALTYVLGKSESNTVVAPRDQFGVVHQPQVTCWIDQDPEGDYCKDVAGGMYENRPMPETGLENHLTFLHAIVKSCEDLHNKAITAKRLHADTGKLLAEAQWLLNQYQLMMDTKW